MPKLTDQSTASTAAYPAIVATPQLPITVTPTISTGAYAAGDALGGLMSFASAVLGTAGSGAITKVVIIDDDDELAPIDIVFFSTSFTPTADNNPFAPSDADMQNCIGYVDVAATDYASFVNNCVAAKTSGLRMPFPYKLSAGTALYAQMVIREAHTYTATDDITVKLAVERYS